MKSDRIARSVISILFAISVFAPGVVGTADQEDLEIQADSMTWMADPGVSLELKVKRATAAFRSQPTGDSFLAAYRFVAVDASVNSAHTTISLEGEGPAEIRTVDDRIHIHRYGRSNTFPRTEGPADRFLLILYRRGDSRMEIRDAAVLDSRRSYRVTGSHVYWLGAVDAKESFSFLRERFNRGKNRLRKRLLAVLALHHCPEVLPFLFESVTSENGKLAQQAVFWLGARGSNRAIPYLKRIYHVNHGDEMDKQTVFAFYLLESKQADRELIKLARNARSRSVQKKAIFWLGQRASRECVAALEEVIRDVDDLSVKSSALFAISQLPTDQSIPLLIDIIQNHGSPGIRKKALFWLGQSGDSRAVDFFERILLN